MEPQGPLALRCRINIFTMAAELSPMIGGYAVLVHLDSEPNFWRLETAR